MNTPPEMFPNVAGSSHLRLRASYPSVLGHQQAAEKVNQAIDFGWRSAPGCGER